MPGVFAGGGNAIVASGAVVHDAAMIEYPVDKAGDVMTHAAILAGGDMRG